MQQMQDQQQCYKLQEQNKSLLTNQAATHLRDCRRKFFKVLKVTNNVFPSDSSQTLMSE